MNPRSSSLLPYVSIFAVSPYLNHLPVPPVLSPEQLWQARFGAWSHSGVTRTAGKPERSRAGLVSRTKERLVPGTGGGHCQTGEGRAGPGEREGADVWLQLCSSQQDWSLTRLNCPPSAVDGMNRCPDS